MASWLTKQQIGFLAHWLRTYSRLKLARYSPAQRTLITDARTNLRTRLERALSEHGFEADDLSTLPPVVLYFLRDLGAGNLRGEFRALGHLSHTVVVDIIEQPHSLFSRTEDLVHHILYATGDPARVIRLGAALFNKDLHRHVAMPRSGWPNFGTMPDKVDEFRGIAERLRVGGTLTRERVNMIGELISLLETNGFNRVELAQLENVLMQMVYAWPLFVVLGSNAPIGLSIPVALDVQIPDLGEVYDPAFRTRWQSWRPIGGQHFDLTQRDQQQHNWRDHLALAARVARDLWRSSHGHSGLYRERVRYATVVYDLSAADIVVEPVLRAVTWQRMPLIDGSAVAYLAQIALGRLLGRRWSYPSLVTGITPIDRARDSTGRELLDYDFQDAGSLREKLRYVFATRQTIRLVIPSGNNAVVADSFLEQLEFQSIDDRSRSISQTAEVIRAYRQSNIADAIHVDGWRKWSYVRLPELAWGLHSVERPKLLPPTDDRVQSVLRDLRNCFESVIHIAARPSAVASALWYLNFQLLPQVIPLQPPTFSWAFIRIIDEEQDTAFWRVAWRLIGAPPEAFERFSHAPTPEEAADALQHALNCFAPDDDRPSHRAPDFLVLVGANRFEDQYARLKAYNPQHRPLAVKPILDLLRHRNTLQPSPVRRQHSELLDAVGKVRIILLEDREDEQSTVERSDLSTHDREILGRLAIFRWGFRQQMAALLLRWRRAPEIPLRKALNDLRQRGLLRYLGGEYHLPIGVRSQLQPQTQSYEIGRDHFSAAAALAPYSTTASVTGLAYDVSNLPEHLIEAQLHLETAYRHFDYAELLDQVPSEARSPKTRLNATCKRPPVHKHNVTGVRQRLIRFGSFPSWDTVNTLLRANNPRAAEEAYLMSGDLLEARGRYWSDSPHRAPHPMQLLARARALWQWQPKRESEIIRLFKNALAECDAYQDEKIFNVLQVLPFYSNYLFARQHLDEAARLDGVIASMRTAWTLLPAVWFERRGDQQEEHAAAAHTYCDGVNYSTKVPRLQFKALGAALAAELPSPECAIHLFAQSDADVMNSLPQARNAYRRDVKQEHPWLSLRWELAFREARLRCKSVALRRAIDVIIGNQMARSRATILC